MKLHFSRSASTLLFAAAASLAACQSANHSASLPPFVAQMRRTHGAARISSTCGDTISIDVATAKCSFGESGYDGTFAIDAVQLRKAKDRLSHPQERHEQDGVYGTRRQEAGFGSFVVRDTNGNAQTIAFSRLAASDNHVCAHTKKSKQTVSLPPTGGVTGSLSFAAFRGKPGDCDYVKVSTGGDIEHTKPHVNSMHVPGAGPKSGIKPILTISVGEGFDAHPVFDNSSIISGMKLTISPDLNPPDGTYYATITTISKDTITYSGVITFTAKDGVLRVSNSTLPDGKNFPLVVIAKTSSIISLYPLNAVPPPPTPSPTPSATPVPTPTPFPQPTGAPGTSGNPAPPEYTFMGTYQHDIPAPPCPGVPVPCKRTDIWLYQTQFGAALIVPDPMYGTVKFDAQIGYMGLYAPVTNDCPKDWDVSAGLGGSGSITIPKNDPYVGQDCTLTFSTRPPGKNGTFYTEEVYLYTF
jgi:hypothetical protein